MGETNYYEKNKEYYKRKAKEYYQRNRQKVLDRQREYYQLPHIKERKKEAARRYREKLKLQADTPACDK